MVQILYKRMSVAGSRHHEHITHVRWYNPADGKQDTSTVAEMVAWLKQQGNRAYVCDGQAIANVGVVTGNPDYIRTHADQRWTDNLLALPNF